VSAVTQAEQRVVIDSPDSLHRGKAGTVVTVESSASLFWVRPDGVATPVLYTAEELALLIEDEDDGTEAEALAHVEVPRSIAVVPECPRGHGPMIRRENPTDLAASQGVWWDCAPGPAGDTCMSSHLTPHSSQAGLAAIRYGVVA